MKKQKSIKIITKYWGEIDPNSLESYRRKSGYEALRKALRQDSEVILQEIIKSGLRGRGGAGFLTGAKWQLAAEKNSSKKYFIANLNESEPGVFKDRLLAENNPHQIVEGLIIAAYAVGATRAFIYLNPCYKKAKMLLENALREAYEKKILGKSVMGSFFELEIEVFEGAGSYVCGEESALVNSMEGRRAEPRKRPPFVCEQGLENFPTVVNNVETLANIPEIILNGADNYRHLGAIDSPGTKLFCIDGSVESPGLYEALLGVTTRELIYDYAGGVQRGKDFLLAQIGGVGGFFAPTGLLDEPLVYGRNTKLALGSGGILVLDKMVDWKKLMVSWMRFFQRESCGKCVPCREGTFRALAILRRLEQGDFSEDDLKDLKKIIWALEKTSFCAFGRFAANGIKEVMRYELVQDFKERLI
ncbi:MAG TPA: NADP oxidoreductase [Candidatus Moranbacteria bacterium]|nr:NADP oxidoreductase [Candidatus Moranbacteria bacterium]